MCMLCRNFAFSYNVFHVGETDKILYNSVFRSSNGVQNICLFFLGGAEFASALVFLCRPKRARIESSCCKIVLFH